MGTCWPMIAPKLIGIFSHALSQLPVGHLVQFIERVIASHDRAGKIDILANERVDAIFKHRHRLRENRKNRECEEGPVHEPAGNGQRDRENSLRES